MSLLTSLRSAYAFESSGSMGTDSSGNSNNLTLTGTVNQAAGNAVAGTNAAVWTDSGGLSPLGTLHGNFNYITASTDFTLTAWVYVVTGSWDTTPYDMFVVGSYNAGTDQYGLFLDQATKEFYFVVSGGGAGGVKSYDGGGAISFSTWYFVQCQWDYTSKNTGIRRGTGSLVETASAITDPYASPNDWCIGSNGHGAGFTMTGRTDAVNLWDRKLTGAEATSLYNSGLGLEYPFPLGHRRQGRVMMMG